MTCFDQKGHKRGYLSMNKHREKLGIDYRHKVESKCPGATDNSRCLRLSYDFKGSGAAVAAEIWLYPSGDTFSNVNCTP
jgi:hypothetical protein